MKLLAKDAVEVFDPAKNLKNKKNNSNTALITLQYLNYCSFSIAFAV